MWTSFHPRRASDWSIDDREKDALSEEQRSHRLSSLNATSPNDDGNSDHIPRPLMGAKPSGSHGITSHPTLWQLQINDPVQPSINLDSARRIDDQRRLSAASSSPSSSRRATLTDIMSSASPPSPFGITQSESSPPSTPPDTISNGYGATKKQHWPMFTRESNPETNTLKKNNSTAPQVQINIPDSTFSLPRNSSRNDIFSASSPVMQPAPRLPSITNDNQTPTVSPTQGFGHKQKSSRNSGFFFGSPSSPSSSSVPSPIEGGGIPFKPRASSLLSVDDSDRPNYGRSNTEERERERERIRQTNMEVEFRLCPVKELMLGEGRHSNVYLGAYRVKEEIKNTSYSLAEDEDHQWRLCAMKRPHADRQSQLLALEEAFALRRLGSHPNIVRLIKIRDEVQLSSTPNSPRQDNASPSITQTQHQNDQKALGLGLPSNLLAQSSNRNRAISEAVVPDNNVSELARIQAQANSTLHRRNASQPDQTSKENAKPSVRVVAPDEEISKSPHIDEWEPESNQAASDVSRHEAPRLLMLLELLPFSLSSFSRRNPELVDFEQWRFWALELARVVEWMHSKGCIHADLKPENILLTSDLHVKLCDFNSALFPNSNMPLMDGMGLGTPAYGAPELSRSLNNASRSYKGFSYPVDIWSLGAILYTLATGIEPFRRARSMIDMMYRKRIFFESEENDRVARMSVAEGSSTVGPTSQYTSLNNSGQSSMPTSRKSSIRRTEGTAANTTASTPLRPASMHRRAPSIESVSSMNSSMVVSSASGMRPSIQAIDMLLDDRTPTGILMIPGSPQMALRNLSSVSQSSPSDKAVMKNTIPSPVSGSSPFATINGHHRASSMGKARSQQYKYDSKTHTQQRWSTQPSHEAGQISKERNGVEETIVSPRTKTVALLAIRPDTLRRTTSYNGKDNGNTPSDQKDHQTVQRAQMDESGQNLLHDDSSRDDSRSSSLSKKTGENAQLRLAVAAAFARSQNFATNSNVHHTGYLNQSKDNRPDNDTRDKSFTGDSSLQDQVRWSMKGEDDLKRLSDQRSEEEYEDTRPYRDGTPALILPGGGRLPDEIRSLLGKMLSTDPDLRPTAAQVRAKLENL